MRETSFDRSKLQVTLLEGIHGDAELRFQEHGYSNLTTYSKGLSAAELLELAPNIHFLGIRSRTQLTSEFFQRAQKLVAVGCFCIGTNQVDLDAATAQGVAVFNAPFSNTRSVAELVLGELILLLRGIPEKNALAHRGVWQKSAKDSYEVRNKRLGIIGYGNIGAQLGVLAEAVGMDVAFYDVVPKLPLGNASMVHQMETLLETSDVVSLHVPANDATNNLIDAAKLKIMKPGTILINASRGTVVDIDALTAALKAGRIGGAALDVFPVEPKSNQEAFESPLQEFDNVILTPHVGGSTQEAQVNIASEVAGKLIRYSDNGSTLTSVNFPEVNLPEHPGQHRILHVHRNEPGILTQINKIFSNEKVNITGQYLQTNPILGYVVTDVAQAQGVSALEQLKSIPGTLKARILF
ncbi:MAG TPA: phosphoglycerate dehydrogenase [Gammaproteobacteria bacterium]|nr:phosphoglycerate dehydrogenase [Gammaproteobacteria bacterium]